MDGFVYPKYLIRQPFIDLVERESELDVISACDVCEMLEEEVFSGILMELDVVYFGCMKLTEVE